MFVIKLKKLEKRELKGFFLIIKWVFVSFFFIFVVFIIFVVIIYKLFINLIVVKERNNVECMILEVVFCLVNLDEELILVNMYCNLIKVINDGDEVIDYILLVEGNLMKIDFFIVELG